MRLTQILRRLARMPGFTAVATLTIAIGVGANTAVFSVIEGVLLKPLPYPRADELVVLDHTAPGVDLPRVGGAPFLYFTYREEGRVFEDVGLWNAGTASVTGLGDPEEVRSLLVTDAILPMLGVRPRLGRLFTSADVAPGAPDTVILAAGYWRSRLGGDGAAIGRTLTIDGRPREIVGVLPESFRFLDRQVSVVIPYQLDRSKVFLGQFSYNALARLEPGSTIAEASADAARLIPISLTRFPPFPGGSVKMFEAARIAPRFRSLKDDLVGEVRTVLWVLMGTIGLVLLIACANVANLLLVRAEARQQELAIRAALGAGTGRIARELLLESVVLALLGGLAGTGLAFAAIRLLVRLAPGNLPRLEEIALGLPALLFALALSVVVGLLFGAIPVFRYAGARVGALLRGGGRTASASRERHRTRSTLVVVQVALALVLLVGSGLMLRTFHELTRVHPGFSRPGDVQLFQLSIPESQIKEEAAVARMHHAIRDRVAAIPGVTTVALASTVTMTGEGWHDPVFAEDRPVARDTIPPIRLFKFVSPGYMEAMGASLVAGRDFTWDDVHEARPVAMVSENLAREFWGTPAAALGKRVRPFVDGAWREVVGVVGDMRDDGLHVKAPAVAYWPPLMGDFFPSGESRDFVARGLTYIVRSPRTGSEGFVGEVSRAVWSVNPNLPLARVRTLEEVYDASLARTSFALVMLAIAGGMALLLGIAGIYGVISYSVSQRTREIGIRMALGAQLATVRRMFVGHGLLLAGIGVAAGLAAAMALTRLLSALLFQVSPVDPLTYGLVAIALLAATALASYVPAVRATAVDPADALRSE